MPWKFSLRLAIVPPKPQPASRTLIPSFSKAARHTRCESASAAAAKSRALRSALRGSAQ